MNTHTEITRTQFDECVGEFLAVDGDTTQQVDELVVGQEVIQQHPVVHLVFTLRQTDRQTDRHADRQADQPSAGF